MPPMSGVRFKTVTFVQIVYSIEVTSTHLVLHEEIIIGSFIKEQAYG